MYRIKPEAEIFPLSFPEYPCIQEIHNPQDDQRQDTQLK